MTITGELTVQRSVELYEALAEADGTSSDLELELSGVTRVDVSCLQLLCSVHRHAMRAGRSVTFRDPSPEFSRGADGMGYLRHKGCPWDPGQNCLWLF